MSLVMLNCPLSSSPNPSSNWKGGFAVRGRKGLLPLAPFASIRTRVHRGRFGAHAFLFDLSREPLLKEALKEPVAFMGGMFAGLLRLDLNEDPLKEWVSRTVEASGITEEEIGTGEAQPEEAPLQIEIE